MKLVDKSFPDRDEISLSKIDIEYIQDLDCCQSEEDYKESCQILKITTDDGGGGKFYRITTSDSGWSFGEINEFIDILNDFKKRSDVR